jgi:ABC-type amino acid transport substrate-binding protein
LRVCFEPDEYPSAFYNNAEPPQLVGFDIEMAHRLAEKLSLPIEFIAAGSERRAAGLLNAGACDLYMKSMPVTARRTQHFAMTSPIYQSSAGLIVRDHRRNEFQSWDRIRNREDPVRLGIEDNPEDLARFQPLFQGAEFVLIENMDRQRQILEAGGEGLDAIIDMAEQGAAWTVLYPSFNLVVPRPAVSFPVSYAVAYDNRRLLVSVDAWLSVEKSAGTVDQLYRYWMLGEAARAERPPRWSVIRNVLGWVD